MKAIRVVRVIRGLFQRAIGRKVLPNLLEQLRVDDPRFFLVRLLLRIQHQLDASARRPERTWVKNLQALVDDVGVVDAVLELEGVNWRDLDGAAERAHS